MRMSEEKGQTGTCPKHVIIITLTAVASTSFGLKLATPVPLSCPQLYEWRNNPTKSGRFLIDTYVHVQSQLT